ncbi:MAG TPA: heme o synthase [Candidatus Saccharimonadales bacterium]|nr:heme o synthase [Candidatus Saccharimonadales bacterium]
MEKIKSYYSLTKPGVMYGNALTAIAGFLLAASYTKRFSFGLFIASTFGLALIISAACALNNYLDRDIDSRMERTKKRASVTGKVSPAGNLVFAIVLAVISLVVLAAWTNWLTTIIALVGFVDYVWLYGAWAKRRTHHGTLVGSVSGAAPILAGYCAVTNHIDIGAILAFLILFFWQMPEFYSISIYRRTEYAAARVPVISVVKGVQNTKTQIFIYTLAYVVCTLLLTIFGYAGWVYFVIMAALGSYWLGLGYRGLKTKPKDDDVWARRMFRFSMITILVLCIMLAIGPLLP